jgi:hypothetical protein
MEYDQRIGDCALGLTTTWTGASAGSGWSQAGSWAGALAPAGTVDTLDFPSLTSGACTAVPVTAACYSTDDDVGGLSAYGISIDDGVGYSVTGDALNLGAGGITASTSATSPTASTLDLPITLGASQPWTISGAPAGGGGGLALGGAVSGSAEALGVSLSNQATVTLGADDEVGPVTVSGADAGDSGATAAQNGTLTITSGLNGSDTNPVALTDVAMTTGTTAATGPLSSTGASIQVGTGHAATLSVAGALSLDPASQLTLFMDGPSASPGVGYSQISATGAVTLSGTLALASGDAGCPALVEGQTDTLITTTGSLSGTFAGTPNGAVVTLPCGSGAPTVQINYTANAVTATAVSSAPASVIAPIITGLAEPGQQLTETPGEWANGATGIVDQWERCNAAGTNCSAIAGVSGLQYTLSAGDLGSTIRIEEVATNANGSTTVLSAPTAVVAVPLPPSSPPPSTPPAGNPSPTTSPGAATPAAAPASANPAPSVPAPPAAPPATAQIHAALLGVLASAGKPVRVGQLVAHGGYSVSIASPGAGTLTVTWWLTPAKSPHAKHKPAAVLVALGRAGSSRADALRLKIRLTALGRRLLARRGKLTLTVTVTFTPAGSHEPVSSGRSFTLQR